MNLPNFDHVPVESGTEVDKLLIMADDMRINDRRNAGVISIAVMRIVKCNRFGLRYLETRYRALDSLTFLVGLPKELSPQFRVVTANNKPAPYSLWVGVNGRDETDAMLAELGFSYEENLDHLDKTGFLTISRQ